MGLIRPTGGALEGLYGAFGNPTSVDRQRLYEEQQRALQGSVAHADAEARRQAMGAATSASGGGNPFLATRLGAAAGGDAAARVQSQGVQQQRQLGAQQTTQEIQARQHQGAFGQQIVGGLLNAGGQVLGMAVPAFGALRGAAGASGAAGALGGAGPLGGLLSSALGGSGQPQQAAPQTMPSAPQAAPQMGGYAPSSGIGGAFGSLGTTTAPPPGAVQRLGPDGQMHWYDQAGNVVG